MSAKIGLECKVYRNTGSSGSPAWVEVGIVRDVKVGISKGEGDVSRRGGGGFKMTRGTLIDGTVTTQMVKDTADTNWLYFRSAFYGRTAIDMAFTDKDITVTGATGFRATYEVMKFEDSEPLDGAALTDVEMKPTDSVNNPTVYTT